MVQGTIAGVVMVHVVESLQDCDHNWSELLLNVTFFARYANTAKFTVSIPDSTGTATPDSFYSFFGVS